MAKVVALNATSPTEEKRQRFEAWIRSGTCADEADIFLRRSRGGEYVMQTTRAAWAAWQAAIADLIIMYRDSKKPE